MIARKEVKSLGWKVESCENFLFHIEKGDILYTLIIKELLVRISRYEGSKISLLFKGNMGSKEELQTLMVQLGI